MKTNRKPVSKARKTVIGVAVSAATASAALALGMTTAGAINESHVPAGWTANVRSGAGTNFGIVGTIAGPTRLTMECWKDGGAASARYASNRWFRITGANGVRGFIHSSLVDAQIPTPNCDAAPAPVQKAAPVSDPAPVQKAAPAPTSTSTVGTRAADIAVRYVGGWGGKACIDAKMSTDGYVGRERFSGGQCRQFVNCVVVMAGGPNPSSPDYSFTGARNLGKDVASARKGDIIQWGVGGHTAIVLANRGHGRLSVVDSNWPGVDKKPEVVRVHDVRFDYRSDGTIWRYA